MSRHREKYDSFAIPRNFGEDGMSFNGISRRNLIEGILLALAAGYPLFKWLPWSLSGRVILLCLVCIPLFILGLVGLGGESISGFALTFTRWLIRRRVLRYYIDTGEEEPAKPKGVERLRSMFRKKDKERLIYLKEKSKKRKWLDRLFQFLFSAKVLEETTSEAQKSRHIKHMSQDFYPVADIKDGIIFTKDGRYVKIIEISPINFMLRSAEEQRDIILSFSELLRITPVKLQFKSVANPADIGKFISTTKKETMREKNEACKQMGEDYIHFVEDMAGAGAISRRFFILFEYESTLPGYKAEASEIKFHLESAVRNIRAYLSKCGNSITEFSSLEEENDYLLNALYSMTSHYSTGGESLEDKCKLAFSLRLKGGNTDEMCIADYLAPQKIDFTKSKYTVIDGVYHGYLYIPSTGYRTLVGAAWLSPLINAGEAIDVDLFLEKQPSDTMQTKVSRNLRLNKAKMGEVSSTSADYNSLGDIMESGYYLQRGLSDGQEFFYMMVLVTVKAYSKKDLENRMQEVIKMMAAKQVSLRKCAYMQEGAFLSTLPLCKLNAQLYRLGKRNILTSTAASTYMFTSFEICDDNGILLGSNEHNNSLVILDLFNNQKYKSANMMICGTTGSGKSFTLQSIASRLRRKGIQTFIIAPLKGHECAPRFVVSFAR